MKLSVCMIYYKRKLKCKLNTINIVLYLTKWSSIEIEGLCLHNSYIN